MLLKEAAEDIGQVFGHDGVFAALRMRIKGRVSCLSGAVGVPKFVLAKERSTSANLRLMISCKAYAICSPASAENRDLYPFLGNKINQVEKLVFHLRERSGLVAVDVPVKLDGCSLHNVHHVLRKSRH